MNLNGIDVSALNAIVEGVASNPGSATAAFRVKTEWQGQTNTVATVSEYTLFDKKYSRHFEIAADEPRELLGNNSAPNPQELLMAALNACMSVGFAANAAAMGIKLEKLEIETEGQLDLRGFLGLDPTIKPGYEEVRYTVRIKSDASREQIEQLHQVVVNTSPNFSNFATPIRMISSLVIDNT
ncbi:osmotically inducible protein C [Burkholderia sp. Nafp2/4-1b]|uniref:OsmC family protein n=1 Tax=Burkholderia sp. Nafp2/4-1b TaxID=2116686 RepID=UPI000EF8FE5C|nr:OsmC family protein [Burkholderia sp. Nafp2/4-1b]RKU04277.1 osmotically inducible protein C [Burkholderia sp. Nafp2/4-1b]